MPKGSDSGLLDKLFELAGTKHPSLRRPPRVAHGFVLRHFAGEVTYDAEGFLSKNKERYTLNPLACDIASTDTLPAWQDRCPEDMLVLLRSSSKPFVRTLFTPTAAEQAQKGRKGSTRGVAHKFNAALEDLTVHLLNSDVCFIRCIKPNDQLQPHSFDEPKVLRQLRSSAVLATCTLAAAGYPDQIPFAEFLRIFRAAAYSTAYSAACRRIRTRGRRGGGGGGGGDGGGGTSDGELVTTVGELLSPSLSKALCQDTTQARKACVSLLEVLGTAPAQYAIGKTMVFMRTGLRAELERREVAAHACATMAVNAAARGFLGRQRAAHRWRLLCEAAEEEQRRADFERPIRVLRRSIHKVVVMLTVIRLLTPAPKLETTPVPPGIAAAARCVFDADGGGSSEEMQLDQLQRRIVAYKETKDGRALTRKEGTALTTAVALPASVLHAAFSAASSGKGGRAVESEEEVTVELRSMQLKMAMHAANQIEVHALPPPVYSSIFRGQRGHCTEEQMDAGLEALLNQVEAHRELPSAARLPAAAFAAVFAASAAAGPTGGIGHETHLEQGLRSLHAHIHTVLNNPPRLPPALLASAFAAAEAKHGRPVDTEAELRAELAEVRVQLQGYASNHALLPAAAKLPAAVWAAAVQLAEERHGRPFVSDEEAVSLLRDELNKNQAHVSRSLREGAQAAFGKQVRG